MVRLHVLGAVVTLPVFIYSQWYKAAHVKSSSTYKVIGLFLVLASRA